MDVHNGETRLVPVEVAGGMIYLSVAEVGSHVDGESEREISARGGKPALDQVLDGLAGFAERIAERLKVGRWGGLLRSLRPVIRVPGTAVPR